MIGIYFFWDMLNDSLEILGEDGEFYFYGEDEVSIDQNAPENQQRYWIKLNKLVDVTPINDRGRFEVMDNTTGGWVPVTECGFKFFVEFHEHAGVPKEAVC